MSPARRTEQAMRVSARRTPLASEAVSTMGGGAAHAASRVQSTATTNAHIVGSTVRAPGWLRKGNRSLLHHADLRPTETAKGPRIIGLVAIRRLMCQVAMVLMLAGCNASGTPPTFDGFTLGAYETCSLPVG